MLKPYLISLLLIKVFSCSDPKCVSCDSTSCLTCKAGTHLYAGSCYDCPSYCDGCINGVCSSCQSVCSECQDGNCNKCVDGYYVSFTDFKLATCLPCVSPCVNCYTLNVCASCISGYHYMAPGNSIPWCAPNYCMEGCKDCFSLTQCYRCDLGYYSSQYICYRCNSLCQTCSGPDNCFACVSGNTPINGFCCEQGASSCNWTQTFGCIDGYLFDGTHCKPCPKTCTSCVAGACVNNCNVAHCLSCYSPNYCNICASGYYANGGKCSQCFNTCTTCSSQQVCTGCQSGYQLISGYCCGFGCVSCGQQQCWQCQPGLVAVSGVCRYCPIAFCLSCSSASYCDKCYDGYYSLSSSCLPCHSKCTTCSAQQVCTGCKSGYTLVSGYCCAPGCVSCGQERCWQCDHSHNLVNGSCL